MQILGPWIAIEPVDAAHFAGSAILKPWTARAPETFIGLVLAIGAAVPENPGFEIGDFVLVEKMSGHPHMAGEMPAFKRGDQWVAGRTIPVMIPASLFGGAANKLLGLVRYGTPLPVIHTDDEAARRLHRAMTLREQMKNERSSIDEQFADAQAEVAEHGRWLKHAEAQRAGCRRSRLMKPFEDPGAGEGILAKIEDADDLLEMGVDPAWLADRLGIGQ